MALEHGVVPGTGFAWVRVSKDIERFQAPAAGTPPETRTVILVMPQDMLDDAKLMNTLEHDPRTEAHNTGHIGFVPVDVDALFPGETVRYKLQYHGFDFDAWARGQVEVPDTMDVTFQYDRHSSRRPPAVVARTIRKGRVVNVTRKIETCRWFVGQARDAVAEMARTCPKPVAGDEAQTVGAHALALLATLDAEGQETVRDWLARDAEAKENARQGYPWDGGSVTIPGAFLIGANVEHLDLSTTAKSMAIGIKATMTGGHVVKDDESGTTVEINAELPLTVLTAMRGRSVADVVGAEWLRPLTVRTTPKEADGTLVFRAFSDNVPFHLGDPVEVDEEEIDRRLVHAMVRNGRGRGGAGTWTTIDVALLPILGSLDRRTLSVVLARLERHHQVDLGTYGHEGWIIKGQGLRIMVDRQPDVDVATLAQIAPLAAERRTG